MNKKINTINDEWFKATIDKNQLKKLIVSIILRKVFLLLISFSFIFCEPAIRRSKAGQIVLSLKI